MNKENQYLLFSHHLKKLSNYEKLYPNILTLSFILCYFTLLQELLILAQRKMKISQGQFQERENVNNIDQLFNLKGFNTIIIKIQFT